MQQDPSDNPRQLKLEKETDMTKSSTQIEQVIYTAKAHANGGREVGISLISIGDSQMKTLVVMCRTFVVLAIFAAIGLGGIALAEHTQHTRTAQVKVTQLSQREIIEKLDGQVASATVNEVTFGPGQEDTPHHHAGPTFGYVLEGEYEHALDDEPVKTYKAGDTFYEPSGSLHRVARNPSATTRTRLVAVTLHPRDIKDPTIREDRKE
jgi:quercetin dioxygenase-like cupin family protein